MGSKGTGKNVALGTQIRGGAKPKPTVSKPPVKPPTQGKQGGSK